MNTTSQISLDFKINVDVKTPIVHHENNSESQLLFE